MDSDDQKAMLDEAQRLLDELRDWVRSKAEISPRENEFLKDIMAGFREIVAHARKKI